MAQDDWLSWSIGKGAWVLIEASDFTGLLYVRLAKTEMGAWQPVEFYVDAQDDPPARMARPEDLDWVVSIIVGDSETRQRLEETVKFPSAANGISTLASHFHTGFGNARNWVAEAYWSNVAGHEALRVKAADPPSARDTHRPPPVHAVTAQPLGGLTDEFLSEIGRSYASYVARGDLNPNMRIAENAGVVPATARSWVSKARKRGLMPPAMKRGIAG